MKLKYILAAGVVALLAGCDESRFLDTKPQGTLNDDLLSSAEGVELLVTSAYAGLKGPNRDMHWVPMTNWTYGEVRSDNAYKGGGGVNDGDFCTLLETFKIDATWANADEKWFQLYCCLQRCNSALRVMNTLDENTLPVLKSRKAEMKVIRAHFFFELVRLFKQVPYFDENVDIDDYKYIPNNQFTREELLGKIAQEFLDAANDLPDTQSQIGRITKNIAYAYAAKAKLYQAYQQDENNQVIAVDKQLLAEVAALCDKVGAQGKAYDLLNDFQKLDQLEYENGVESVFAVQYSMDDETEGAGNINWSNLLNAPKGPYGGDGFFLPSQNLINAYKTDAYGLPLFDTFNNSDYGTYEGNELTNVEATVDPRLDFVTGRPGITWKTYTVEPCKANWIRNSGEYGFNCTKRFYISPESEDMFQGWPWGASHLNWQIIRYADVLLWKAEALIEIGEAAGLEGGCQFGAEDRGEFQAPLLHHVPHLLHLSGPRLSLGRALYLPQVWEDLRGVEPHHRLLPPCPELERRQGPGVQGPAGVPGGELPAGGPPPLRPGCCDGARSRHRAQHTGGVGRGRPVPLHHQDLPQLQHRRAGAGEGGPRQRWHTGVSGPADGDHPHQRQRDGVCGHRSG